MTDRFSVSGDIALIRPALTVDTAAYATGDLISKAGTVLTIVNAAKAVGGGGLIQSVGLVDQAKQSVAIDVVFFDSNPSLTTFTDNAAFDIDDADMARIVGVAQLTQYFSFNDNSYALAVNLAIPFVCGQNARDIYCALVARGAPTYVAATDLVLTVGILPG